MEKAKHSPPVPWFYSQRIDGPRLGTAASSRAISDMGFLFKASEQAKIRKLAPFQGGLPFPLNASRLDDEDVGRILHKVPCQANATCFHLRSIFGRYVAMSPDGYVKADRETPWGPGSKWALVPHPLVADRFCLQGFNGQCVAAGSENGGPFTVGLTEPQKGDNATVLEVQQSHDSEGPFMVVVIAGKWALTANINPMLLAQWQAARHEENPYEMTRIMADLIPDHERFSRKKGLIAGLVIGGLIILFVHNAHFALTTKSSAVRARLPEFDVMRFVLEGLVIHAHLRLLGLQIGAQDTYMTSFRMTAFILIAGIFGANVAYESMSKLLCCTVGTVTLMVILRWLECWVMWGPIAVMDHIGKEFQLDVVAPGLWFLVCLAGYRLLLSPLYHAARKFNVRLLAPCVFVKLATYFLMHWTRNWQGWVLSQYVWDNFLAFAPYFAVGLMMTSKEWDGFLKKRWVQALSFVYFVAWYLLVMVPAFMQWNSSYCLPYRQRHGCTAHYDPDQFTGPVNIETFLLDHVFFMLRLGVTVSFMGVAVLVTEVAGRVSPQLVELMAGWGSRTLYTYVIHIHCITILTQDAGVFFDDSFPRSAAWVINVFLPVFVNVVLSSQGSEHWFKWLLMPFWIKDVVEGNLNILVACKSRASQIPALQVIGAEPGGQQQGSAAPGEAQPRLPKAA